MSLGARRDLASGGVANPGRPGGVAAPGRVGGVAAPDLALAGCSQGTQLDHRADEMALRGSPGAAIRGVSGAAGAFWCAQGYVQPRSRFGELSAAWSLVELFSSSTFSALRRGAGDGLTTGQRRQ